jgi:LysM repeat protein
MKKLFVSFVISVLAVVLFISPASAAAAPAPAASNSCGMTYTVTGGENLSEIALKCGLTLEEILDLNPQIINANLIYTGQVIRMNESADFSITQIEPIYWLINYYTGMWPVTPEESGDTGFVYIPPPLYPNAAVSVSIIQGKAGDKVTVKASGFPAYEQIDYRFGQVGHSYTDVYDGATGGNGNASITINIPLSADPGESWVVYVLTTSGKTLVSAYSPAIYIISGGSGVVANVDLSKTEATIGESVTVYVSGFPANVDIDYRIGKKDQKPSVIYDGSTDASGEATFKFKIPSGAVVGERWIVHVITSDLIIPVEDYSPLIYIVEE